MKRIVCIVLIALMLTLCGCGAKLSREQVSDESMFVIVEEGATYQIVYHKRTKVMYAVSHGAGNCGSFYVMLNADGTPQVWKGADE